MNKILYIFLLAIVFSSCGEYQDALKSTDINLKLEVAINEYNLGNYSRAIRLFEEIAPSYRGKPQAETLFYMFSQAYYKSEQYYLAAYQFESFASSYPKSEKVEEAYFLSAKCYSMLSPMYNLDQIDTNKAIVKLQEFIDIYPLSIYFPEANQILKALTDKLEKKVFESAKLYNTISDHKAAIVALDNFISDYPGTPYKGDALFYKFDSTYNIAINSVYGKMEERLNNAKNAYGYYIKASKDEAQRKKADMMLSVIEQDLQKFSKTN
jgi:outer membrane protein assembly factor BamD